MTTIRSTLKWSAIAGKVLYVLARLCVGGMFVYFGLVCLGKGEDTGMLISFVGMLLWALAENEVSHYQKLLTQALDSWEKTLRLFNG